MKKQNIILFLFLLVGLSILNYPFLSQWVNRRSESQAVESYEKQIDVLEEEKKRAIKQEAEAYNKELLEKQTGVSDGFSVKSKRDDRYERILNTSGDGIMGVLRIPKIQVHLPIYHGTSAKVLEEGVGHLYGSSFPTGGEGTHSVFSSHRGLPSKTLFTDLESAKRRRFVFSGYFGRRDGIQGGGDFDSRAGRDRSSGNYSGKRLCNPCNMYSVWNQFSPPSCERGKDSLGREGRKNKGENYTWNMAVDENFICCVRSCNSGGRNPVNRDSFYEKKKRRRLSEQNKK